MKARDGSHSRVCTKANRSTPTTSAIAEPTRTIGGAGSGLASERRTFAGDTCQTAVSGGRLKIVADSDAFIVKGLIALLLRLYADRKPEEILANPPDVFDEIGLGKHLSPSRANGLHAMVNRIRQIATAAARGAPAAAAN